MARCEIVNKNVSSAYDKHLSTFCCVENKNRYHQSRSVLFRLSIFNLSSLLLDISYLLNKMRLFLSKFVSVLPVILIIYYSYHFLDLYKYIYY